MVNKLNSMAFGFAGAIFSAICMLLLGILGNFGLYMGAVNIMMDLHIFFSLSIVGIIAGIIEAMIISFVALYLFAWLYNKLVSRD